MCAMPFEIHRSSEFTFQSSVHSSHLLCCLNEQRKRDILCDVTVVVENQSFRAHRSVLASCSEYIHTKVSSLVGQGLVITLPDEVTVEGFDPLLQFAYTAKLLFTKTNILEIHKCATILGFHNLEKACFDFLIPKFFDSSRSAQVTQQKVCCKEYWKEKSSKVNTGADIDDDDDDYEEVKEESKDTDSLDPLPKKCTAKAPGPSTKTKEDDLICTDIAMPTDSTLLCPKYRKFQKACRKERFCPDRCSPQVPSSSSSLAPARKGHPSPLRICPIRDENEGLARSVFREQKTEMDKVSENEAAVAAVCPPHAPLLLVNPNPIGFGEMPDSGCSPSVGLAGAEPDCCTVDPCEMHFLSHAAGGDGSTGERPTGSDPVDPGLPKIPDREGGGERSSVEREVAEHLAQGFWSEYLDPVAQLPTGRSTGCCWFKQLERPPNTTDCPFLRNSGVEQGPSQMDKMPYDSSLNSGDDSDFDTEGASECYSSERVHKVWLPFPVEQIVSLSRNEFQHIVKQHPLTQEQLDFVHDVRRRSKNCVAARRCRKRKMDCIHNLECEIEKLRCEKEKLTQERNQLNHVKLKTWQDISSLYEKVCSEAALRPEQLQVLAKYSTPDCPLSALLTPAPSASPRPQVPPSTSACLPTEPPAGETHRSPQVPLSLKLVPAANHSRTLGGSTPDGRGPSSVTDVYLDLF
ncbi:hypothetical protein AAFF_G00128700 [Aldrovandia affinis]|uniref:Transcription regulator protein BACH1 n=1 Tax=Aldrovandia affinis TaxID=143900 RepID=A0AAD7T185_9TELE|nr:hypothetical protein AAFF_G00128700 [Aldrovandia affinis]